MNKLKSFRQLFFLLVVLLLARTGISQTDSISKNTVVASGTSASDSVKKKKVHEYNPGKAALRSAIIPGWGQVYNRKYWKVPIVYGALGTTAGIFFYNLKNYRDTRFAYRVKYNMRVNFTDSALYSQIKDVLKPLSESSLRSYRDQFRRDIDYSAVFFLIMWGLNVVDAAVDAHLKSFDVSPDLSLRIKPGRSEIAGTTGLSLVLQIGKKPSSQVRMLPSQF
ncbi:MAG: hypothetical protein J0H92_08580 [Sphingobacteriales bacterium]|nr:hypothetical protein [Sphingobacteriales bacterium]